MKSSKVERQNVYLAYRKLLEGKNARVRSKRALLRVLRASPESLKVQGVKHQTISILMSLLHKRVFELEEAAKIEFPELWADSSQKQQLSKTTINGSRATRDPTMLKGSAESPRPASISHNEKSCSRSESYQPDVELPKISYTFQHWVLSTMQQILEISCYEFARKWFPSVAADRAWTCAAALELTKWLHIMNDRIDTACEDGLDERGRTVFKEIRPRLALLRHSAVHRLYMKHSVFLEQFDAALMLTEILRDDSSKDKLQAVYTFLRQTISEIERRAEAVQQGVRHELLILKKQRDDLDRREQQLRASAAEQFARISKEVDRSLFGYIGNFSDADKLEKWIKIDIQRETSGVYVDEDDIESDEDQLQANL